MKSLLYSVLVLSFGLILLTPVSGQNDEAIFLESEYWKLTVHPRWGGRASSMVSLIDGYDYVTNWGEIRRAEYILL